MAVDDNSQMQYSVPAPVANPASAYIKELLARLDQSFVRIADMQAEQLSVLNKLRAEVLD
jgi:hypothetical protein